MASIKIKHERFPDIVVIYLLDVLMHGCEIENELFDDLIERIKKSGLKTYLINYFLYTDSSIRVKYKNIRKAIKDSKGSASLKIGG